jgi:hypothetical protein
VSVIKGIKMEILKAAEALRDYIHGSCRCKGCAKQVLKYAEIIREIIREK